MIEETDGPQVISLAEVRQRRQEEAEEAERTRERARRQAWDEHVLTEVLVSERMARVELLDMLRLGIVTDDPAHLPCQDRDEPADYFKWLRQAKGLLFDGEAEEDARPRYADEPQWSIDERTHPRPRHTVECPLMASAIIGDESPACIEALRRQAEDPYLYSPEKHGHVSKPLDPEDLVVKHELRPCVVVGRHALRAVMRPVWDRERQDSE